MTKNRVTVEEIKAAIRKKEFVVLPDGRTTICILTMDNGFTIRGKPPAWTRGTSTRKSGKRSLTRMPSANAGLSWDSA